MHPCRLGMPFILSVTSRGKEDDSEIAQQLLHRQRRDYRRFYFYILQK